MCSAEEVNEKGWTVCVSECWKCHADGVLRRSCQPLLFVGKLRAVTAERTCGHRAIRVQRRWERALQQPIPRDFLLSSYIF